MLMTHMSRMSSAEGEGNVTWVNKHLSSWGVKNNNQTSWSAYETAGFESSHFLGKPFTFSLWSTHPQKLVITRSVFTHLPPPSISVSFIDLPLIGLITLHSLQTKSNRRMTITLEHTIYLWLCLIFQLHYFSLSHRHTHRNLFPLPSLALRDNINAGFLVVMSF